MTPQEKRHFDKKRDQSREIYDKMIDAMEKMEGVDMDAKTFMVAILMIFLGLAKQVEERSQSLEPPEYTAVVKAALEFIQAIGFAPEFKLNTGISTSKPS